MPEDGLVEVELELVAQVCSAEHLRATASRAAEDVPEHIPEDVAERIPGPETAARSRSAARRLDTCVPELIVRCPLLRVGKDLASLLRFLEPLLRFLVVGIAVGVVLHREPAIGFLDFRLGRALRYVENLVVVALCHACLNHSPLTRMPPPPHPRDTRGSGGSAAWRLPTLRGFTILVPDFFELGVHYIVPACAGSRAGTACPRSALGAWAAGCA